MIYKAKSLISNLLKKNFYSIFLQTIYSEQIQYQSFKIIHPYLDVTFHLHELPFLRFS